jgi:hypothetical protein
MAVDIHSNPPTTSPATPDATPPIDFSFTLEVLDIYTLDQTAMIPCSGDETPIQALAKSGYLGNTPVTPTLAISFRTLELFRRMRLRKSSFSVEAFSKVMCDLYSVGHTLSMLVAWADAVHIQVPYRRRYRTALADALEIYITIIRSIENLVSQELGRDTPDWRVKNACPPCTYEECTHH